MIEGMYVIIWRYRVKPEQADVFERHYGAAGSWVELFRRAVCEREAAAWGAVLAQFGGLLLGWLTKLASAARPKCRSRSAAAGSLASHRLSNCDASSVYSESLARSITNAGGAPGLRAAGTALRATFRVFASAFTFALNMDGRGQPRGTIKAAQPARRWRVGGPARSGP